MPSWLCLRTVCAYCDACVCCHRIKKEIGRRKTSVCDRDLSCAIWAFRKTGQRPSKCTVGAPCDWLVGQRCRLWCLSTAIACLCYCASCTRWPAVAFSNSIAIPAFNGTPPSFAECAYGAIQVIHPQSKSWKFSFFLSLSLFYGVLRTSHRIKISLPNGDHSWATRAFHRTVWHYMECACGLTWNARVACLHGFVDSWQYKVFHKNALIYYRRAA